MLDTSLLPLRNDRARIRTLRPDDAPAYVAGTQDPAVRAHAHLPEARYTVELVTDLIAGTIREGLERGDLAVLAISDVRTDQFVGSLVLFDVTVQSAEVGFWMHPDARGAGTASAALELAVEFVRASGIRWLVARTAPDNQASSSVLARAGLTRIGSEIGEAPSGHRVELARFRRDLGAVERPARSH